MHYAADAACAYMAWLCRAIEFEIVIIDDNSQDNTQGVVRQLQQLYGEDRIVTPLHLHHWSICWLSTMTRQADTLPYHSCAGVEM